MNNQLIQRCPACGSTHMTAYYDDNDRRTKRRRLLRRPFGYVRIFFDRTSGKFMKCSNCGYTVPLD